MSTQSDQRTAAVTPLSDAEMATTVGESRFFTPLSDAEMATTVGEAGLHRPCTKDTLCYGGCIGPGIGGDYYLLKGDYLWLRLWPAIVEKPTIYQYPCIREWYHNRDENNICRDLIRVDDQPVYKEACKP